MAAPKRIRRQKRRLPVNIYETSRYKRWRAKVFKRDRHICRLCGANKCYVEAHHIKRKAVHPHLMYRTSNGVTLCEPCHSLATGQEGKFVTLFNHVIKGTVSNKFLLNWRKNFENGEKRWMQRRGILRHLKSNHGHLPKKSGMIKMNTKSVQKGMKRVKMWKRRSNARS